MRTARQAVPSQKCSAACLLVCYIPLAHDFCSVAYARIADNEALATSLLHTERAENVPSPRPLRCVDSIIWKIDSTGWR